MMARSGLLLSQLQLAERWGKDPKTIARWTSAGLLPTFEDPDSHRIYYPLPSIQKWEADHKAPVAS